MPDRTQQLVSERQLTREARQIHEPSFSSSPRVGLPSGLLQDRKEFPSSLRPGVATCPVHSSVAQPGAEGGVAPNSSDGVGDVPWGIWIEVGRAISGYLRHGRRA